QEERSRVDNEIINKSLAVEDFTGPLSPEAEKRKIIPNSWKSSIDGAGGLTSQSVKRHKDHHKI
ncbi:hypothetical protein KI387_028110, partial [Taxus chinensis]